MDILRVKTRVRRVPSNWKKIEIQYAEFEKPEFKFNCLSRVRVIE